MSTFMRVRDLFDLPEQIRKGDFVLKLGEGIEHARETARSYVVTPALADAFDRALRLVGSALGDGRSQAAYLHGSFGSGKSHFMALLSLLLANREEAWRIPELHHLRERHSFVAERRLLELHFHMIGQDSIEAAIFGEYLAHLRSHHPDAPIPGLFADETLFADAARMLEELGDEAFFAPMNQIGGAAGASSSAAQAGTSDGDDDWGDIDRANHWDRQRFERIAESTDPREREALFNALVSTRFRAYAQESRAFVDLDAGLAVLARHAAELGYDGVVLFLDELILWLASGAANASWLHTEIQKMVKLVEAREMRREIPLVSFIARQRDLAAMVGKELAGAENSRLQDSLEHWQERYNTIWLEDTNLPAIVEKRVLVPRDGARAALDRAFEDMRRQLGSSPSWQVMLGSQDGEAFRKLYPFSPALVEALVALSSSLQRQRTAIRLLMEMLVEHMEDLAVGEVVRVGDLFDLLASGEDSADGVMRARFEAARQLYKYQFLPLIQDSNGTGNEQRCQRLRPGHPLRLGCAGCAERACRTDNRLIKTLLVAALVPEVPALKEMTASKLVQLNHGSLKVPIPGTEAGIVAQKLRQWASAIGQLHVGTHSDPTVRLQIEGVDVAPILLQARHFDTGGARQRVVRDLLFDAMSVDKVSDWGKDHKIEWRSTSRLGHIRFGNVRKMSPDQLSCPDEHEWRLVVDYPFDDDGFGPNDDLGVIEAVREQGAGTWSLVWLPSFFSESMNKLLGELVILEHILESRETSRRHVSHLSVEHQSRALLDLENLRNQKRARLMGVLEEAYGLARARDGDLDTSRSLDRHLYLLKPGAALLPLMPPNLGDALERYVHAVLEARYPRHPHFTHKLAPRLVEELMARFGEIVDAPDKRIGADKATIDKIRGTLGELGLVRVSESAVHLVEDLTLQEIEKRRQQKAVDQPTVAEVQRWNDDGGTMGLQAAAADVVVRCYARWAARTFVHMGRPYEPSAKSAMPADVVLERPDLPSQAAWSQALIMAGHALGVSLPGKALHADNLARFEAAVAAALRPALSAVTRLPGLLGQWAGVLGVAADADRLRTARSAEALCTGLAGKSGLGMVEVLAGFTAETSARALGHSIGSAGANAACLGNRLVLGVFDQLRQLGQLGQLAAQPGAPAGAPVGADEVLERAAVALRQDEVITALAPRLEALAEEGQRSMAPVAVVPVVPAPAVTAVPVSAGAVPGPAPAGAVPAPGPAKAAPVPVHEPARGPDILVSRQIHDTGRVAVLASLRALVHEIEAALAGADDDDARGAVLYASITLRKTSR